MKNKTIKIITVAVVSILLFLLSYLLFSNFSELFLPDLENIKYVSLSPDSGFKVIRNISIVIGLIPIFLTLNWHYSSIKKLRSKVISAGIVLVLIAIAFLIRRGLIQSAGNKTFSFGEQSFKPDFNIENLNYEYYMFFGLILGCLITYFLMKPKTEEN